jgi:hypothetical protein
MPHTHDTPGLRGVVKCSQFCEYAFYGVDIVLDKIPFYGRMIKREKNKMCVNHCQSFVDKFTTQNLKVADALKCHNSICRSEKGGWLRLGGACHKGCSFAKGTIVGATIRRWCDCSGDVHLNCVLYTLCTQLITRSIHIYLQLHTGDGEVGNGDGVGYSLAAWVTGLKQ